MYLLFIGSFHTKTTSSKIVHSWCEFKSVAIVFEWLSLSLCAHPNLPLYTQIWFSVLFNRESYDWILFQLHTIPLYGLKSGERKSVNLNKIFSFHYRASAKSYWNQWMRVQFELNWENTWLWNFEWCHSERITNEQNQFSLIRCKRLVRIQ